MKSSALDTSGAATRITAEAHAALNLGDTERAQAKFEEAAKLLQRRIGFARRQSEKQLLRFLAATQYYKGGHYRAARAVCQKIESRLLPANARPLYPRFLADVRDRADPAYPVRIGDALRQHFGNKEYRKILGLLQDHPYVLPPGGMAFLRGICCEHLKDYHAAALFFASALRSTPDDPELLVSSAVLPLALIEEQGLEEAWKYVEYQLREIPHAMTFVVASLVRFDQASEAGVPEERVRLSEEQLRYFDKARSCYEGLPQAQRAYGNLKEFMSLSFQAAAFGLLRLGRPAHTSKASELLDEAQRMDPNNPYIRQTAEEFRASLKSGKNYPSANGPGEAREHSLGSTVRESVRRAMAIQERRVLTHAA